MLQSTQLSPLIVHNGLSALVRKTLVQFIHDRYPSAQIEDVGGQGGCSYTLFVTKQITENTRNGSVERFIIQFRFPKHAIPFPIACQARTWYCNVAPTIQDLGHVRTTEGLEMQMCRISYLAGTRFSELQPKVRVLDDLDQWKFRTLTESLVDFHTTAWNTGIERGRKGVLLKRDGKIGATILSRLRKLEQDLPSSALRTIARAVRAKVEVGTLDCLPNVLTHGDLIPSNILVDPETWKITGLVDWAEAEYLPFGVSLYGLEHLLGYLDGQRFVYYEQASVLRNLFWRRLHQRVPDIRARHMQEATRNAQLLGVLLWHGYAWDDGKIDRVVQSGRDDDELGYLSAFMDALNAGPMSRL